VNVRLAVALSALVAVLGAVAVAVEVTDADGQPEVVRAKLQLDGKSFRPELALTGRARARGLMLRKRAPADGMLFVFPAETNGGFWMKNTLVPLTIVFFDSRGARVRRLSMKPCTEDPCPLYVPKRRYRFALELPAADERRALRLGPEASLRRLAERAT
jgi:uncharacterized membrane protein (UPF0127 family)